MCQEHYDKVVQYAESIGDSTLRECLERLERREQNPHHPCQIELYRDFAPYSFLFKERYPDGSLGVVGGLVYHGCPDRSCCFIDRPFHGWATHLKNRLFMRMKILRYAADRDNRFGDVRTTVSDLRRGVYIRFVPCLLRRMTSDKTQLLKAYAGQSTEIAYHQDNSYICKAKRTPAHDHIR